MFFFSGNTVILALKYLSVASCELIFTRTVRYEWTFTFLIYGCLIGPTFLENYHFFVTLVENQFTISEWLFLDTVLSNGSAAVIILVPQS